MLDRTQPAGAMQAPQQDDEDFRLLDTYAGGEVEEPTRLEPIATISAGFKEEAVSQQGQKYWAPRASRDGRIHLHDRMGRAPGLRAALERGEWKRLTITFSTDRLSSLLQQRFMAYSQTRLEAYGDGRALTEILPDGKNWKHVTYQSGTPDYERVLQRCKVSASLYFTLIDWFPVAGRMEPRVVFPDGFGVYRLRTTSRHSLRSIIGTLDYLKRFTRGYLAGLPFELALDYKEVADPSGAKRLIPYWTLTLRPPEGYALDSGSFRTVTMDALAQGRRLMLPEPPAETLEDAEAEIRMLGAPEGYEEPSESPAESTAPAPPATGQESAPEEPTPEVEQPTDEQLRVLNEGGPCDSKKLKAQWGAVTKGTRFESDEARRSFMLSFTSGKTDSLRTFAEHASQRQADELIAAVQQCIELDAMQARQAEQEQAGAEAQGPLFGQQAR